MSKNVKIQVYVPEPWAKKIKHVVEKEGWSSVSDYIRHIIREDLKRRLLL